MNPAPNLILVGPTGAGKTSIGKRVAERFGLAFVDADQAIVDRTGASIATLFEHVGEAGAAARVRTAVWAHLKDRVEGARGTTAEVGADVVARV